MPEIAIELFVEDVAQEAFLGALIYRRATERGVMVEIRTRSARGGSPRALSEFRAFQRILQQPGATGTPDLVVVARDTDCRSAMDTRNELLAQLDEKLWRGFVAACPDPCIETWYLLDPKALQAVVGAGPPRNPRECDGLDHKEVLREAIRAGGAIPTLGGAEIAPELVDAMDLFRAGKNAAEFKHLLDELDEALARTGGGSS